MSEDKQRVYKLTLSGGKQAIMIVDETAPKELRCRIKVDGYWMFFEDEAEAVKMFVESDSRSSEE